MTRRELDLAIHATRGAPQAASSFHLFDHLTHARRNQRNRLIGGRRLSANTSSRRAVRRIDGESVNVSVGNATTPPLFSALIAGLTTLGGDVERIDPEAESVPIFAYTWIMPRSSVVPCLAASLARACCGAAPGDQFQQDIAPIVWRSLQQLSSPWANPARFTLLTFGGCQAAGARHREGVRPVKCRSGSQSPDMSNSRATAGYQMRQIALIERWVAHGAREETARSSTSASVDRAGGSSATGFDCVHA